MTPVLYIWEPNVDFSQGTIARAWGIAKNARRDSLQAMRNVAQPRSLDGWLRHRLTGSARGSLRMLEEFRGAIGMSFGHASLQLTDAMIGYWPPFREGEQCTPADRLLIEQLSAHAEALRQKPHRTEEEEELLSTFETALEEAADLLPYEQELEVMGREPTHRIELPGLDEAAMLRYWEEKALQTAYQNRTHNCCTVAYRAINRGLEGMAEKMSFFSLLGYGARAGFRLIARPLRTGSALATEIGCETFFWNPQDLRNYALWVNEVALEG